MLILKHVKNHMIIVKKYLEKPLSFLNSMMWSDETKIEFFSKKYNEWNEWKKKTCMKKKFSIPTKEHREGSLV